MRALVLQHVTIEGPGTLAPYLEARVQLFIPALIIGAHLSAVLMRMTRSALLEVLREDYVRTTRAKGLRERAIILKHALKNACIPVETLIGQ